MANLPYVGANQDKVLGIMKMYSRMGAYPLDATSVFNSKADLEAYIAEKGSYAYAGQIVAVANGDVTDTTQDTDYSFYAIRSDKSVQEIGKNLTFETVEAAGTFVAANTTSVRVGELVTVTDGTNGYSLHVVKDDYTLQRVSFDTADVPDVTWANLQNKPTSTVEAIDDAVAKAHEHANKEQIDKFTENANNKPAYDGNELAYKSELVWGNIGETPDTAAEYGITDVYTKTEADGLFVEDTQVVATAEAGKILKLDDTGKFPANILNGTIPLDNLPHGALERCHVVENDDARFALTTDDVQTGDTVKVTETGLMYFIKDDTKLAEEAGYEVYTAGSASSVDWTGVQNKPTTISGYGITDAVNSADVVDTAAAGKILKLNNDSKLPASITGDADTVDGKHATDFVAATDVVDVAAADKLLKLNGDAKLPASITGDADTVDGKHATDFFAAADVVETAEAGKVLKLDASGKLPADITGDAATVGGKQASDFAAAADVVTVAEANKVLKLDADAKLPADITGNAATATNVEWTGVQNKPNTLAGYGITDAVAATDVTNAAAAGKILKLNDDAKLPADITGNAATADQVEWTGVQNTPTTVDGYGITDVYTQTQADGKFVANADLVAAPEANKVLKLNADAKLPADITGNAATATNVAWSGVTGTPTTLAGYGIADAYTQEQANAAFVPVGDVATTPTANKLLKLDANAQIPANILNGIIPIANIPHGALERCVVVAADTDRFALTETDIQLGDTVKVTSTGKMYFVVDTSKLAEEAGYEIYTAGSASSVAWSGVTGTPDTVAGYGITDAYTKDEANAAFVPVADVVTVATADKVLKLNSEGKLPTDITGEAGSVAWANVTDKPTSAVADIDDAVTKRHEHANKEQLDKVAADVNGKLTYDNNEVAYMANLTDAIYVGDAAPATLPIGGLWLDTTAV